MDLWMDGYADGRRAPGPPPLVRVRPVHNPALCIQVRILADFTRARFAFQLPAQFSGVFL